MRPNTAHTRMIIDRYKHRIEIMQLWMEGHPVEFRVIRDLNENWCSGEDPNWEPAWAWDTTFYRIKHP